MTSLTKDEIIAIFQRTKKLYPQLMIDRSTGQDYNPNHPAAEGIATIFKIKLDEFDHLHYQIEEGKKKCLSQVGYTSVQDMYNHRHDHYNQQVTNSKTQPLTLGDFMVTSAPQKRKKNKKHK